MQDQVRGFARDGHALIREVVTREEVAGYRPVIKAVVEARKDDRQGRIDDYSKLFTQVTNIWRLDSAARAIVLNPRFGQLAAELLGVRRVRVYHDQALFKPPGAGRTPWHQDRYYWPLDTDRTVTMWMPLVDVEEAMGPMIFASGSHRERDLGDVSISEQTDERLAALIAERGWPLASQTLRAGDATFHLGATLHSAGANRSNTTREVLTVIYYDADARVADPANDYQRVDLQVFLPGLKAGDPAATELNPVV